MLIDDQLTILTVESIPLYKCCRRLWKFVQLSTENDRGTFRLMRLMNVPQLESYSQSEWPHTHRQTDNDTQSARQTYWQLGRQATSKITQIINKIKHKSTQRQHRASASTATATQVAVAATVAVAVTVNANSH